MASRPRRTRAYEVSDQIRNYIIENDLKPGDMLLPIEKLADQFDASRGTVREALMHLASSGLVEVKQGRGTWVAAPKISDILASVVWKPLLDVVTSDELVQARCAVEAQAAFLAAQNATPNEVENLRHLELEMETSLKREDFRAYVDLDRQWHHSVARMSNNRILAELTVLLHKLSSQMMDRPHVLKYAPLELQFHSDIARSLETHEAKGAQKLMERHIQECHATRREEKSLSVYCDVLGTGSVGGSFYALGQEIVRLLERHTWVNPTVHATGGGIENVNLTRDRHIGLSIAQVDVAADAYFGRGEYHTPYSDLRFLCRLPGLEYQVVTLASSGIRSIADLRGKRVAIGARGGTSARISREVLALHDLKENEDYFPQMHPISTAVHMVLEGQVDALCFLSMGQSSAILDLACQASIRMLPLDREIIATLLDRHPSWYECVVEANTYPGQPQSAPTIGVPTILLSHRDVSDADAHAVTAAILRNVDQLSVLVRPKRRFSLTEAIADVEIPRHPGALKFLLEEGLSGKAVSAGRLEAGHASRYV